MAKNMPHGTRYRYIWGKCRCPECIAVNTSYQTERARARYAMTAEQGLPAWVSHGLSAYSNWGCRCDVCKAAGREASQKWYAAHKTK